MNLYRSSLPQALAFAIFGTLFTLFFFPRLPLSWCAPAIVIACYQKNNIGVLRVAFFLGLFLDLFSFKGPLGLESLIFMGATLVLFRLKSHFFADMPSTMPIMAALFSFLVTVLKVVVYPLFDLHYSFGWRFFLQDLVFLPGLDGFVAYLVFVAPSFIWQGSRERA